MRVKIHATGLVIFLIIALSIGVAIYHNVEGWSYLDAAYFLVITATTIGYGDLTPVTALGKIITMIYSFIGIAFVFYVISLITHNVFEKNVRSRTASTREKMVVKQKLKDEKRKLKEFKNK